MIEVLAAVLGAAISVVAMGMGSSVKRTSESRDAVIRLTVGVESIANKLEQLHMDIRSDRKELFGRIGDLETRVAKLEAHSS